MRLALLLAFALAGVTATAVAQAAPPSLEIVADAGPHLVGEHVLVRVRATDADGAPLANEPIELAPFGARAVTNQNGDAVFRVVSGDVGAVTLRANATGAGAIKTIVWSEPVLDAGGTLAGFVGTPLSYRARLTWAHDGSPIVGANAGIFDGQTLVALTRTTSSGEALFQLESDVERTVNYLLAFDEPWLQSARQSLRIAWTPPNAPPSIERVDLAVEGNDVVARPFGVADPDGDQVEISYTWYVDGRARTHVGERVPVSLGSVFRVAATPSDRVGFGTTVQSPELRIAPPPPPPPAPQAAINGPRDLLIGEEARFDGSGSTGSNLTYSWRFSDGGITGGRAAIHAFASEGAAWAELTVRDSTGRTATARHDVRVARPAEATPDPPTPIAPSANNSTPPPPPAREEPAAPPQPPQNESRPPSNRSSEFVREVEPDGSDGELVRQEGSLVLVLNQSALPVQERNRQLAPPPPRPTGGGSVSLGRVGNDWTLVKAELGQAELLVSEVQGASEWWIEDGQVFALAHRGAEIVVVFVAPPVVLDVTAREEGDKWILFANATGGGPLSWLIVSELRGDVIAQTRERTIELVLDGEPRVVIVEAVPEEGEVAREPIFLERETPIEPATRVGDVPRPVAFVAGGTDVGYGVSWAQLATVLLILLPVAYRIRRRMEG